MHKSAGIIFYRYNPHNNNIEFLLQKRQHKNNKIYYEDLGGKKDPIDRNLEETAAREASEESNAAFLMVKKNKQNYNILLKFCQAYILKLISENKIILIHHKSGYILYLVYIMPAFRM